MKKNSILNADFLMWDEKIWPWLSTHGLKILLMAIGAYIIIKVSHRFITKAVRIAVTADRYETPEAEAKRENTLIQIFNTSLRVVIITVVILMSLQEIGIQIGPILAAAGVVGLALGFGGQYLIRDLISGFFIIFENQYRIDDTISIDGTQGVVEGISLRMTTLRDLDGTVHHIPNGEIKKVSNLAKRFSRVNMNIGVGYNSDIDKVIKTVNEIGVALSVDPGWRDKIITPPQFVRVQELGDSAVVIKIVGDVQPSRQWEVAGELRKRLLIGFREAGIEIPFPQRVIHNMAPEQPR